ncbi:MAG: FAD-dependent oxidoreductase [Syntrophaceae bacterium]|nr:FAD-dependent oxidoreductase [Syntrophaceae bacterium]
MWTDYDVVIIGGGPAGLAAGIYTSRAGLRTLLLEKGCIGGEVINRELIENYPGFGEGIQGPELASAMAQQMMSFGAEFELGEVTGVEVISNQKIVSTTANTYSCQGIIVASGSLPRKLNVPGEELFAHRGVFYCATCDGPKFAGKEVAVAGAGDSGITEALALARIVPKVTVIEFMPKPKASKILMDRAFANPKIEIRCATKIEQIIGEDHVTALALVSCDSGEKSRLPVEGILVRIGLSPNTQFLSNLLPLTPAGQIPVNESMETAIPGIFAAGDVRQNSPMQIATAVGDGVHAAMSLGRYVETCR